MLEAPDLRGDEIVLRPWKLDDLDELVSALQDPEIPRWTRIPEPYTGTDGRAFLERSAQSWIDGNAAGFAILDPSGKQLLGSIGVVFHEQSAASVGYWVARDARGRGIATRALRLVAGWALQSLGVERLELVTDPDNTSSQRVAEKAGFQREGLLRRYLEIKGMRRDCVMFSLLRSDLSAQELPTSSQPLS
jgi:RimJ/RimL family protein N-acetyltransferase